jgi:hypothetical protein
MADDSTEQRARLSARERFDTRTGAGTKARGVVRQAQFTAARPGDTTGLHEIESPADDGDALQPARIELTHWLRSRKTEHGEAIYAHVQDVAPHADDPLLAARLRQVIAACIDCGLEGIERGGSSSSPIPPVVAEHARQAAGSGVSLTTALRRCVAGHTLAWSFVLNEVAHHELPDEQRFALLLQASTAMGSLLAGVQAEIAAAHSSEIARKARSLDQRRAEIVNKLLVGGSLDAGEVAELGYAFDAWHIAVIATGADAGKLVRCLESRLGCDLLPVAHGEETVRAWLGAQRRLEFADVERVVSSQQDHAGVSLAVGEPARGLKGWRLTHQEAEGAALVARYSPRRLTRYLDVSSEATALQDEAFADSLIETYLSPLDDMGIGGQAARRTLRALFDTEHQVSSAARKLDVDRSTVHRRRNEIEERLGCRLHERQAEVELAVRIEELREHRGGRAA